jgi:hypothetical protein
MRTGRPVVSDPRSRDAAWLDGPAHRSLAIGRHAGLPVEEGVGENVEDVGRIR